MFGNNLKPAQPTVKGSRRIWPNRARDFAIGRRASEASLAKPVGVAAASPAPYRFAQSDRIGAAFTLLLSLGLLAAGSITVAQLWTHLAMVR
jgi:hypothetical protein